MRATSSLLLVNTITEKLHHSLSNMARNKNFQSDEMTNWGNRIPTQKTYPVDPLLRLTSSTVKYFVSSPSEVSFLAFTTIKSKGKEEKKRAVKGQFNDITIQHSSKNADACTYYTHIREMFVNSMNLNHVFELSTFFF